MSTKKTFMLQICIVNKVEQKSVQHYTEVFNWWEWEHYQKVMDFLSKILNNTDMWKQSLLKQNNVNKYKTGMNAAVVLGANLWLFFYAQLW